MIFISIYYTLMHLALGRSHMITVLVLLYLFFFFSFGRTVTTSFFIMDLLLNTEFLVLDFLFSIFRLSFLFASIII